MWKQVLGYENAYMVNEEGDLINRDGNLVKKRIRRDGYQQYTLCKEGIRKNFKVHRLVAIHFVDNPNHYYVVNHIDGNKLNNHYLNLEWCTCAENNQHAWDNGLKVSTEIQRKSARAIISQNRRPEKLMKKVLCIQNGTIYNSITEAAEKLNICREKISAVCKGKRQHTGGYRFIYAEAGM